MPGGGGGSDSSGKDMLEYQKKQDALREQQAREGMRRIDAMFDGGQYGYGQAERFNPNQVYYGADGQVAYDPANYRDMMVAAPEPDPSQGGLSYAEKIWNRHQNLHREPEQVRLFDQLKDSYSFAPPATPHPLAAMTGRPDDAAKTPPEELRRYMEMGRDGQLFTNQSAVHQGFDDSFFDQRADDYLAYANPQIDKQFNDAGEQLVYALARAGTGQSSVATNRWGRMQSEYDQAREQAGLTAQGHADAARQQLADERARLTSLVQSGADPAAINSMLPSVASALDTGPVHGPIGPLFQNATAGIGAYQDGRMLADTRNRVNSAYETNPFG